MLFGDEPRFYPDMRTTHRNEGSYAKDSTTQNVGPGSHYSLDLENKRTGWIPRSFGLGQRRQPMTPGANEKDRSDYYIHGMLTPGGVVVPNSSDKKHFPSPGQYEGSLCSPPGVTRRSMSSPDLRRSSCMGSSSRFASLSTVLKGGVVVTGSSRDADRATLRGPGAYAPSHSTYLDDMPATVSAAALSPGSSLVRRSYNVRASSGNTKGVQAASNYLINGVHNSPYHSPRGSPRYTPAGSPRGSPRMGSPRHSIDYVYGSPKNIGIASGGVSTPMLVTPHANKPLASATLQGQAGKQQHMRVGGAGGGFGLGSTKGPSLSPHTAPSTPPPLPAQQQQLRPSVGRGTPTRLLGTANPAVDGSAPGAYLALYAGSPVRRTEKAKPSIQT